MIVHCNMPSSSTTKIPTYFSVLASVRADCVTASLECSQGGGGKMCLLEFPGNTAGRKFTNLGFL
jgi:hypothetical protein